VPTQTRLSAAIVGCGRISAYHVAALKELPDVEIVAVCDLREKLARDLASQAGNPHVFTDMEAMMRQTRPDVVHVVTPPQSHVLLADIAAEYSANMYIEKPFATTQADAEAILAAAQAARVEVCAGHSRVFDPTFREASRRIESGEVGRVLSVRAEQGFTYQPDARSAVIPWDHRYDWGIFENLMPHPLSVACHFLNKPGVPQVVGLNVGSVREAAVEELRILIPAENAIGEVTLSLSSPELNRLEVVGTRGRIVVDFDAMTVLSSRENGLPSVVNRFGGNFATAVKLTRASTSVAFALTAGRIKRYMGIRALIAEFYRSLREGSAPPILPEEAVENVRLMEQIREASEHVAKARMRRRESQAEGLSPRVLVTGGSGFLGGRLVERLAREGIAVRATTRLISRAKDLPNVEWIECDLTEPQDLRRAVDGVETIFHCAGMVGPPGSLAEYQRVNVDVTLDLAEAAEKAGVANLVYISSLSVYASPPRGARSVDENFPSDDRAADRGVYSQTKLQAEQTLLEYVRQREKPRVVVLRPGIIYGPGAPPPLGLFQLPSTKNHPIVTGGWRTPIALSFIDNVIDAMLAAAESDVPTGSVYNVVDSDDISQGDVCREVRRLTEEQIRPVRIPYPVVWTMMLGIDLLFLMRDRRLGTARYRLKRTLAPVRYSSAAAHRDLEWQPRITLAEGLSQVLADATSTPLPSQTPASTGKSGREEAQA